MPEAVELTNTIIEDWIKDVIDNGNGYLKVVNYGGAWIIYENGAFHQKFRGITTELFKSKKTAKEIFRKRISRYQNVQHNGSKYWYDRGTWRKSPASLTYD